MSYCQYNNAYINNDDNNLDKLARKINDERKKTQYVNAKNNLINQTNNTCIGIDCLSDPSNSRFAPTNLINNYNYLDNNNSSNLPTPILMSNDSETKSIKSINSTNSNLSFISKDNNMSRSIGSINSSFDNIKEINEMTDDYSTLSNTYSILNPIEKKHYLKLNTKHLKELDNKKDDKKVLLHIQNCNQCRDELLNLLGTKINSQNNIQNLSEPYINSSINSSNNILNLTDFELKDILILILIGITIIILLDFFIKK